MVKRCSKRRGARMHRRTRRGGINLWHPTPPHVGDIHPFHLHEFKGGRKKMMRTRRRTRRGGKIMMRGGRANFNAGGSGDGRWGRLSE